MCGRFALTILPDDVAAFFSLAGLDPFPPRYNIAPTQPVLVVTAGPAREPGSNLPDREAVLARWGFLPSWVKDPNEFPLLVNARSETASEKNSFRNAMRHRRVLIPASGFYEWQRAGREKAQPFWIRPTGGGLVAFGGLMETWEGREGSLMDTACILTTSANAQIGAIHDRMPVVIRPEDFSRWLDCRTQEPRDVADLMQPVEPGFFEVVPVSTRVNKVANSGPDIQEPVEVAEPQTAAGAPGKAKPPGKGDAGQMSLFGD
ncbi:MAG: SOS response-associated peptidase [Notoacmeibacter sp.]|nr:SOS response-associated peptidase [Notoacmeibacter sp.]